MTEPTIGKGGIEIAGTSIGPDDDRLPAIVRDDPMRRQIVDALLATKLANTYASIDGLDREVTFRQVLVRTMNSFQTGESDADYFVPDQLHPQMSGTKVVGDQWQIAEWQPADVTDPYSWTFTAPANPSAGALFAASAIFPFRGECAGAFQLCTYIAAYAALGDDVPALGASEVGDWKNNPARALYQHPVPLGSDLVPGDWLYFKNKDDYLTWAPDGFWQGLNSMYMGMDALGTKRYSGLGAAWLNEDTLRSTLVNAYSHDCFPHRVDDPGTEVRFTRQASMRLPFMTHDHPSSKTREPAVTTTPTHEQLLAAGFVQHPDDPALYERRAVPLAEIAQALGFDPAHLRQTVSAPASGAPHHVNLGSARCIVTPTDTDGDATRGESEVTAHVRLDVNRGGGS